MIGYWPVDYTAMKEKVMDPEVPLPEKMRLLGYARKVMLLGDDDSSIVMREQYSDRNGNEVVLELSSESRQMFRTHMNFSPTYQFDVLWNGISLLWDDELMPRMPYEIAKKSIEGLLLETISIKEGIQGNSLEIR